MTVLMHLSDLHFGAHDPVVCAAVQRLAQRLGVATVVVSGDTAVVGAPLEDSSTKRIDSTRDEGAGQASIVSLREDSLTLVFDRGRQPAGNDKNSQRVGKLNPSPHSHLLAKLPFPRSTRIPPTPQS